MARRLIVDDLISDVRSLIDEINADNISNENDILPAMNRGQDYIASILARKYAEPLLTKTTLQLVPGQELYDIPEDAFENRLEKIEVFINQEYYEVRRISFRDVTNVEYPINSMLPQWYTVIGNQFKLLPNTASSYSLRLWYLKDPKPLVTSQGQLTLVNAAQNYVIVDEPGTDLTTEMDNLNSYVNIIDGESGNIKKTLQIQSIADQRLTFKTIPTRSIVLGLPVSGSFTDLEVQPDDYICTVHGTCIPFFKKPISNFLITFAATDIKVNKLGGDPGLLANQLSAFEKQIERMWVGQEQTLRVTKVNRNFGGRGRRRFIYNP